MRSLHYLNGGTLSPFPAEPEHECRARISLNSRIGYFMFLLPMAAYLTLAISASCTLSHLHEALFGVGVAALLLLFVGIHNAWDAVTYHVFVREQGSGKPS
jgi:hypothetical protein